MPPVAAAALLIWLIFDFFITFCSGFSRQAASAPAPGAPRAGGPAGRVSPTMAAMEAHRQRELELERGEMGAEPPTMSVSDVLGTAVRVLKASLRVSFLGPKP